MRFTIFPIAYRVIESSVEQSKCYDKISKAIRNQLYGEFVLSINGSGTHITSRRPFGLYHNSFEPSVLIDISQEDQIVRCTLNYSLRKQVLLFQSLFYSLLALMEVILIICRITTETMPIGLLLIPLGMIVVCYAFVNIGFNAMVSKYTQLLAETIES